MHGGLFITSVANRKKGQEEDTWGLYLYERHHSPLLWEWAGVCVSQVTAVSAAHTHKETESLGNVSPNPRHTPSPPSLPSQREQSRGWNEQTSQHPSSDF